MQNYGKMEVPDALLIRAMKPSDWESVADIYEEWIQTKRITFVTQLPSWEEWNSTHYECCRLVAQYNGIIAAWAGLGRAYAPSFYQGVAEVSIYVAKAHTDKGIGTKLLQNIIWESEKQGYWTLLSRILEDNTASIKLHEKEGFRYMGRNERVAQLSGRWRDVLVYERRSPVIR